MVKRGIPMFAAMLLFAPNVVVANAAPNHIHASIRALTKVHQTSQTYYVSPTGDDNNPGTSPAEAWKTTNRVNAQTLQAGDHVLFQGGATFSGSVDLVQGERGTASSPIVIGSYGKGKAMIQADAGTGIYVYDTAGIVIQNLKVAGSGVDSNDGYGIEFFNDMPTTQKLDYVQILNDDVSGFNKGGIYISAWNTTVNNGYQNISIRGCDVSDNGSFGISTFGNWKGNAQVLSFDHVLIRNCLAHHNVGLHGTATHSGDGIVIAQVGHGVIENCKAYDNGQNDDSGSGGPAGIWTWGSNDVVIQHCVSYGNHTANGQDGDGFDLDGGVTNSVLENNISYNNDGAGYLLCQFSQAGPWYGNIVRDNKSTNDGRLDGSAGLLIYAPTGEGLRNSSVYDNVFTMSPAIQGGPADVSIFMNGGEMQGLSLHNNVFIAQGGVPFVKTDDSTSSLVGIEFKNDVYEATNGVSSIRWDGSVYESVAAWHQATEQE